MVSDEDRVCDKVLKGSAVIFGRLQELIVPTAPVFGSGQVKRCTHITLLYIDSTPKGRQADVPRHTLSNDAYS